MISYDKINKYFDSTGIKIFELENLKISNNNARYKEKNGVYFPIRYRHQFISLLQDYIAGYLKYKKIYPDLKIIFFTNNFLESNPKNYLRNQKFLDDLVFHFNSEIINTDIDNYIFDKVILNEVEMTVIPREIYDNGGAPYEFDEKIKKWRIEAIPLIYAEFSKYIKKENNNKIYVSRSKINKQWKKFIDHEYLQTLRVHDDFFDEALDEIFKSLGFNVIEFFDYGFFEQINISFNSDYYVSIDGSSLINAMWANNDCKIIKIITKKNYAYYWDEKLKSVGKSIYKTIDVSDMDPPLAINYIKQEIAGLVGFEPTT